MPPKQKSEPINLSIRANAIKYPSILSCLHDDDSKIIEYLTCGVQLYLKELKKILKGEPYEITETYVNSFIIELSDEFIESESILLKLFGQLIKNENPSDKTQLITFFKKLKLALELDIKHDHGGSRGHGVGKECVQFITDNGKILSELGGITPLDIIKNKGDATVLSNQQDCLPETDNKMKFPPLYKILDTKSKKCVKEYLNKTQTIKCLPTIIDSAGQSDNVGEPPDFDILFELIVQNFGELLFSSMFKSLVDDNIYLFTFLPGKHHSRDEWLKNTKSYIMRVILLKDKSNYDTIVSNDIIVNTGQTSQFSVPKITMFNSRTLLQYLKSPESIYRTANMGKIWSALCISWDPTGGFPLSVNEKHVNDNLNTKMKAEVLVRDLQYVKKICGDGCQNFATLVYSNLKTFFKHDGSKYGFFPDTKGYYKNTTTETFDTYSAVVSSVLDSSYSIGTTSIEFQYTLGDTYARFYNKSYIEVWRLFSNSYPLLLFDISGDSKKLKTNNGRKGGHNNIKYNYVSESSDYSDYSDDDTSLSNEFYNKLLLNYKNKKGGMEEGDDMEEEGYKKTSKKRKIDPESEKESELKTQICLQKLNYEQVYKLNEKIWDDLKSISSSPAKNCRLNELVQFIFTQIDKDKHLEKFLTDIPPNLSLSLNQIARLSEQSYSLKKQAEISNLMLKRAATGIQIDTNAFKIKYDEDLRLNKYQTELKELVLGNTVKESFFDVVEDIYDVDEHIPKKDIKLKCDYLNKTKLEKISTLKTDYGFRDDLEGNDLLKQCLDILTLKYDNCDSDYNFLFDIWNDLVENLKEFLVSISNKGRIFFVEDSVSKKMLVLIQILFPFIYEKSTDKLSIMLPKRYDENENALQSLSYNEEEITDAISNLFKGKSPFDVVAENKHGNKDIQDFSKNTQLQEYVTIHNCILLFSYCNLIYRLHPISLLEKAILKQFTIFDEEEMNKVDKSRTIDVLELIRIALKTWHETDIGEKQQTILEELENNPQSELHILFKLFHEKNIDGNDEYKYPKGDLSSRKEHITLMQQYCNKYSLSLKKAFDLIEFLRNGNKKLDELQSKLKSNGILQLYFNKVDLEKISVSIERDKEKLVELLRKQKKVISDFISNILPGAGSEGRQDDEKNLDEINFAKEIKKYENSLTDLKESCDNIAKLKQELNDLQKELEKTEEELETFKKSKAKLKRENSDTASIEDKIEKSKTELNEIDLNLKKKKDEYDETNSNCEYNVLLLFLETEESSNHINFLRRMFELSESTYDDIKTKLREDEYKKIYQEFKVGLGLDHVFLESPDLKDEEIVKHLTRILHNAIDFKHILFSEKQKLESDDADSGINDSLEHFDLKEEQEETVQNLIKLLSNQLLTFKGLRTANEYKEKLNNINKKINETIEQYQERVKKVNKVNEAKYPILKHVVSLIVKPNKYEINQGLVDYLSVKEEELKTLLRILQLYDNCKMLESKLKKAGEKGEEEGEEEEDEE